MGLYTKALRHVNNKDFKRTHQRLIDEKKSLYLERKKKLIEEHNEIKEIKTLSKAYKSDWKKELTEAMVTTGAITVAIPATDTPLDIIDAADSNSFTAAVVGFDTQDPQDGLSGAQIISNGTGFGSNGGFNLGRSYLSFNGTGFDNNDSPEFDNKRVALLTPIDTSRATTLEISAIVGNGSNGGESPSVDQDLQLWYTDKENYPNSIIAALDDNGNFITAVPYNGSGTLKTYSVTIPNNDFNNLRKQGVQFVLYQDQGNNPVITGDNYGIVDIRVKRTVGINALVSLDSPEAVSFFRTGTGPNIETPEQRYRKITQQLLASKKYTTTTFGSNFPGSNFNGISGVLASPIGNQASYDTWSQAAEKNAQQSSSTFAQSQQDTSSPPIYQYGNEADFQRWIQSQQTPIGTQTKLPGGGTLTRVSDAGFKPQTTVTYNRVTNSGTTTIPSRVSYYQSVPSTPPKTQVSPKLLTPQQLSNLDKQIADLQRQSEKNKQDARNNQWRAVGELGMGALQAAAILSPIPGDEAVVAAALAAKTGPKAAGAFAKANPGKYNPFLSQQSNKYFNLPRK